MSLNIKTNHTNKQRFLTFLPYQVPVVRDKTQELKIELFLRVDVFESDLHLKNQLVVLQQNDWQSSLKKIPTTLPIEWFFFHIYKLRQKIKIIFNRKFDENGWKEIVFPEHCHLRSMRAAMFLFSFNWANF